jgi:hypothetical protein
MSRGYARGISDLRDMLRNREKKVDLFDMNAARMYGETMGLPSAFMRESGIIQERLEETDRISRLIMSPQHTVYSTTRSRNSKVTSRYHGACRRDTGTTSTHMTSTSSRPFKRGNTTTWNGEVVASSKSRRSPQSQGSPKSSSSSSSKKPSKFQGSSSLKSSSSSSLKSSSSSISAKSPTSPESSITRRSLRLQESSASAKSSESQESLKPKDSSNPKGSVTLPPSREEGIVKNLVTNKKNFKNKAL